MNLKIYTDGGAHGNPGPAAFGVVVKDEKGNVLAEFGEQIGHKTNNAAEYQGVVEALKSLRSPTFNLKSSIKKVDLYIDSLLVVNQLNGTFKVKNSNLREKVLEIRRLEQELKLPIFYHFVPREKNLAHVQVDEAFRV